MGSRDPTLCGAAEPPCYGQISASPAPTEPTCSRAALHSKRCPSTAPLSPQTPTNALSIELDVCVLKHTPCGQAVCHLPVLGTELEHLFIFPSWNQRAHLLAGHVTPAPSLYRCSLTPPHLAPEWPSLRFCFLLKSVSTSIVWPFCFFPKPRGPG